MSKNDITSQSTNGATDFDRMVGGRFYNCVNPAMVAQRTRARWLADKFNRTKAWNIPRRTYLIKRLIPNHGSNFFFEPTIRVEYGKNITFGDDFYMNFDCQLLDVAKITIGNGVMFGPRVILATPVHPLLAEERIQQQYPDGYHDLEFAKPITVGNNVWIASGAIVCGGVTIGDNTVIAAGSVVTRDIPANVIAAGVPCKVLRQLDEGDKLHPWETYLADGEPVTDREKAKLK